MGSSELGLSAMYRILKKSGASTIRKDAPDELRRIIEDIATDIAKNAVKINMHKLYNLAQTDIKAKNLLKWMQNNSHPSVNYNLFGTVTGRITTRVGSFPIMNLKTELKPIVEPKWDCYLELDFNAAEIRTLLALSGQEQPEGDIHEWHQQQKKQKH